MPELGEYDCLVRTESCAICNSTDGYVVAAKALGGNYPAILGHESIGVVERCGVKVRTFRPGDRVLRPNAAYPGESLGGFESMWGGFAEYTKVRDAQAMVADRLIDTIPNAHSYQQMIPGDIRLDDALLMTGQKEIWSSTVQMEPVLGRRFLVTGAGITACLFGLFLRMKGAASPLTARWLTAGRTARTW